MPHWENPFTEGGSTANVQDGPSHSFERVPFGRKKPNTTTQVRGAHSLCCSPQEVILVSCIDCLTQRICGGSTPGTSLAPPGSMVRIHRWASTATLNGVVVVVVDRNTLKKVCFSNGGSRSPQNFQAGFQRCCSTEPTGVCVINVKSSRYLRCSALRMSGGSTWYKEDKDVAIRDSWLLVDFPPHIETILSALSPSLSVALLGSPGLNALPPHPVFQVKAPTNTYFCSPRGHIFPSYFASAMKHIALLYRTENIIALFHKTHTYSWERLAFNKQLIQITSIDQKTVDG